MTHIPFNPTESDERKHVVHVRSRIHEELDRVGEKVSAQFADVIEMKK